MLLTLHLGMIYKHQNLCIYNWNCPNSSSISVSTTLILSSIGYILALTTFVRSIDTFFAFIGDIFGVQNPNVASLGYLFGKVLQPFVWFLGVDWNECEMVSRVLTSNILIQICKFMLTIIFLNLVCSLLIAFRFNFEINK